MQCRIKVAAIDAAALGLFVKFVDSWLIAKTVYLQVVTHLGTNLVRQFGRTC